LDASPLERAIVNMNTILMIYNPVEIVTLHTPYSNTAVIHTLNIDSREGLQHKNACINSTKLTFNFRFGNYLYLSRLI